jgi:hypothetical protein
MTNTQNVTELQPRMTREQLIDAARKAPSPSCRLWRMVNELANRLDYTSVALCEAMAQRKNWLSRTLRYVRMSPAGPKSATA